MVRRWVLAVASMVLLTGFAGCSSGKAAVPPSRSAPRPSTASQTALSASSGIVGKWWVVGVALHGRPTAISAAHDHPYVEFLPDGTVRGDDAINVYDGHYKVTDLEDGSPAVFAEKIRVTSGGASAVGLGPSAPASAQQMEGAYGCIIGGREVSVTRSGTQLKLFCGDYILTATSGPID